MSGFNSRTDTSAKLIELLKNFFWDKVKNEIVHCEYGYETHITQDIQSSLRIRQSKTAKHVRFAPDFLVYKLNLNDSDCLVEYKVTKTPRYTFKDQQWYYGQIEADALENYINLIDAGINVAVVIYCPYSERPLLCDTPSLNWVYGERQTTNRSQGSGTDFYNIDLRQIKSFQDFMSDKFKLPNDSISKLLNKNFYSELMNTDILKTDHYYRSYYNNSKYLTGFNWLPQYK